MGDKRRPLRRKLLPTDVLAHPWMQAEPCPCGAGAPFGVCCDAGFGLVAKAPPRLTPPGPSTGFAHPKCFMRATANCSSSISKEHWISQAILRQFGETISFRGTRWQAADQFERLSIDALASNILCARHNACLAPLDHAAGRAFERLRIASDYAMKKSLRTKPAFVLIDGEALQLWGLKAAMGLFESRTFRGSDHYTLEPAGALAALTDATFPEHLGLYAGFDRSVVVESHIGTAPIFQEGSTAYCGIRMQLASVMFDFLVYLSPETVGAAINHKFRRPVVIDLIGRREACIIFTWQSRPASGNRVEMELEPERRPSMPPRW